MNDSYRYLSKRFMMIVIAVSCFGLAQAPAAMAQGGGLEVVRGDEPVIWETLSREKKVDLIKVVIKKQAKKGVTIQKEPAFYVEQINAIQLDNPVLGNAFIGSIFRSLAISFRDFNNGEDPEELIIAEMGEAAYEKTFKDKAAFDEIYKTYLRNKSKK